MERPDYFSRQNRPTMLQIQYLQELKKLEGTKRGAVAKIAEMCQVNHAAVSRFLKSCHDNGYLKDNYEFTWRGNTLLNRYLEMCTRVTEYLRNIGIPEDEIPKNVKDLMENVDFHTLNAMTQQMQKVQMDVREYQKNKAKRYVLNEIIADGRYNVDYLFLKVDCQEGHSVSMADRGFQKPALLRHNKRGAWLELTLLKIHAVSRLDGRQMQGYLTSLKYESAGVMKEAAIKNSMVKIPLCACRFHHRGGGKLAGMIPVTVACSVGRIHMPESTALLVFWV